MTDITHTDSLTHEQLRTIVLGVSVTRDVDITITEAGAHLDSPSPLPMPWDALGELLHDVDASAQVDIAHHALSLHGVVTSLGDSALPVLRSRLRAIALPITHPLHPGAGWVREGVPGGVLTRGLGVTGLMQDRTLTVPLPRYLEEHVGIDSEAAWSEAVNHAEEMAGLMMCRVQRDIAKREEHITLRTMGGVDALGLLGTARLRRTIALGDGTGMRAVAAPTRHRAWVDIRQIDHDYVQAAYAGSHSLDVGYPAPLLVTAEEVTTGKNATIDLRDRIRNQETN